MKFWVLPAAMGIGVSGAWEGMVVGTVMSGASYA